MTDFFQNGVIATLHNLTDRKTESIEAELNKWKKAVILPIALTLSATQMNIYRRVPSVSVYTLPSFLSEFPGYIERMINFPVSIPEYKPKPKQIKLR